MAGCSFRPFIRRTRMATETFQTPISLASKAVYKSANRTAERIFFGGMAVLLCVIVYIGFSPSYFSAGMFRAPLPSPILHVHGAVFTLWMILFPAQVALVSARRLAWHRTLGTIAFCLPPFMIVVGMIAALDAFGRKVTIGPLDPSVSLAIPLIGIVGFTILIFASWRARRKADTHKRLILLATIGLTEAAFGRFPWARMGLSPAGGAVTGLGILVLLVIAYDLFSLRRIHRSTLWGAPLTFVLGAFAVPIGMTNVWHSFAAFLARTAVPYV
jgi:hypothetical protein